MNAWRLDGDDTLAGLRAHLARSRRLLQIQQDAGGNLHWLDADAATALPARAVLPLYSPKAMLFSEQETLFAFDGKAFRAQHPAPEPTVLFGVSACDLAAIHYQDRFFSDDPWYQARRAALLLVGIDCTTPCDGGFCPLTDSGPFVREGQADLVLHREDGGGWLLFATSNAGDRALAGLQLPAPGHLPGTATRAAFRAGKEPEVSRQFADLDGLRRGIDALDAGRVPMASWRQLGSECITCSGCSTVCPTCSCAATRQASGPGAAGDEPDGAQITTVRFWDSCLWEGFQREASGYNPGAEAGSRIARFWTHKFGADFVARYGHYTCIGCGRCDRVCPSGIGARAALTRLAHAADDGRHSDSDNSEAAR